MMLTDADLSAMTAQYQGNTISAIQAKPESLTSLEHLIVDMGFEPGDYLVLMRRNINHELVVMLDPSPAAYMKALNKTSLHVGGKLIYFGDDFTYHGNDLGYDHTPDPSVEHSIENVAGVALGLYRVNEKGVSESTPYTYLFVDRQQLMAGLEYQEQECFNGVVQDDKTVRGLMINIAIRSMMKWQINSSFRFPVNFDRYFQLVELHDKLVEQCQQEFRREASVMASSMRHFRSVKAIPSVVDSLVPLPGRHANAVPLIRLFDKPKTQTTFNFEDFGI